MVGELPIRKGLVVCVRERAVDAPRIILLSGVCCATCAAEVGRCSGIHREREARGRAFGYVSLSLRAHNSEKIIGEMGVQGGLRVQSQEICAAAAQ